MARTVELARRLVACSAFVALHLWAADPASADQADVARADRSFREGSAKLAEGDYASACPLLADSYGSDPATGALLALALCHERSGMLASAAREYAEAADRSAREGRADREQAARAKVSELTPRLSTLILEDGGDTAGLEVALDGEPLEPERLGAAIAVDGGERVIRATAPGKRPWQTSLAVAESGETTRVVIPQLESARPSLKETPAAPAAAATRPRPKESRGLPTETWIALGTVGAGVIGLGIGTAFAVRAAGDNGLPADYCGTDRCNEPYSADDGDRAALSFVVGGLLVAAGATIYFTTGDSRSERAAATQRSVATRLWATPAAAGAELQGRF
jgi:hypothetical protein